MHPAGLRFAICRGDLSAVHTRIKAAPDLLNTPCDDHGSSPLFYAARDGHVGVAACLLDAGAEVDCRNRGGYTPLYWASTNNREHIVRLLLSRGAVASARGRDGSTALMHASLEGHVGVLALLLAHHKGCELDAVDTAGRTALWRACAGGHTCAVRLLLEAGADPMVADRKGRTPLQVAELRGRASCVSLVKVCVCVFCMCF